MKFPPEVLEDILMSDAVVERKLLSKRRWSLVFLTVFRYGDSFYRVHEYEQSTEMQSCGRFDLDGGMVPAMEVVPVEQTTTVYLAKPGEDGAGQSAAQAHHTPAEPLKNPPQRESEVGR
jgi:hypothetical protein